MRLSKILFPCFFVVWCFSSCEKEEKPISPHKSGDTITNSVSLGTLYKKQAFFDLESNRMVSENNRNDWDLGFESGAAGYHVILNAAKFMSLAPTGETALSAVVDTAGFSFEIDAPSGSLDSTAFGEWVGNGEVFILNRGQNHLGIHQGFKKLVLESVGTDYYVLQHANLDGSDLDTDTVYKNELYNFSFISCAVASEGLINVEPPKEDWDIMFSQYSEVFHDNDPPTRYLVTGVLINRYNTEVAEVFDKDYADIVYADIANYDFSADISTIGYDWKEFDLDAGEYTVFPEKNYIIRTSESRFFKIHFIDFYDQNGNKGTPTFEFQEL
jgi:hypothetical protein